MNTNLSSNTPKGFTLVEMLVTITIIVILAGLSLGGFSFVTQKQANAQAELQIKLLSKGLEEYKLDTGSYPAETGGSNALFTVLYFAGASVTPPEKIYLSELDPVNKKQGWTEGTGAGTKIIDPWGSEYIYRTGTTAKNPDFDLVSKGKDGVEGTPDDLDNL
jgi:general secretion pathway protein G